METETQSARYGSRRSSCCCLIPRQSRFQKNSHSDASGWPHSSRNAFANAGWNRSKCAKNESTGSKVRHPTESSTTSPQVAETRTVGLRFTFDVLMKYSKMARPGARLEELRAIRRVTERIRLGGERQHELQHVVEIGDAVRRLRFDVGPGQWCGALAGLESFDGGQHVSDILKAVGRRPGQPISVVRHRDHPARRGLP